MLLIFFLYRNMKASLLMEGFPKLGNVYRYFNKDYVVSMICGSYRYGVRSYLLPLNITKQDYLNGLRLYSYSFVSKNYKFVRRGTNFSNFKYECKKHLKYFIDCLGLHAVLTETPIEGNITTVTCITIDKHNICMFSANRDVRYKKVIPNIELVRKALEYNINYIIEKGYRRDSDLMSFTLDELIKDCFIYSKMKILDSQKSYIYKYEIYKRLIEQL